MTRALAMTGIGKSFGANRVLDGVDFDVNYGEVHTLVGENGAGKSTLMKILQGLHAADEGAVEMSGIVVPARERVPARSLGIGMVFQEFSLIPTLTVAQNVFLTDPTVNRGGFVDDAQAKKRARETFAQMGVDLDVTATLENLPTAQWQLTEIAKALVQDAKLLILDEPTASLAAHEAQALFSLIARLKERGIAVVYISHRMDEIYRIADRITVLRDGKRILTDEVANLTPSAIVEAIIGRRHAGQLQHHDRSQRISEETLLAVEGLSVAGKISDVSFTLRKGEILGLAGLMGSGRTELVQALFGLEDVTSGTVHLCGEPVRVRSPREAIRRGLALIPEDRRAQGLVLEHPVSENLSLTLLPQVSRGGFVDRHKERGLVTSLIERLSIKLAHANIKVNTLSGGNQQKVVIGKWLGTEPTLLMMDEPTAGVDIGTKSEILDLVRAIADEGTSVIFISSELPELLSVSDRILVLRNGRIEEILHANQVQTEEQLQLAVQGVNHD